MAAIQGWDRAIGSLLGAFLRGRAESQQAETLRKILEQQQRQSRGLDDRMGVASGSIPLSPASDQAGTFGNAPFVSPADTPMLPNPQFPQESGNGGLLSTLGNALKTAGRYTLEGMTPGNAEADPIALQVRQSLEETKRKRSLADALELAKAKAQFRQPGFTEQMYQDYARIHGPEAAMKLWEQSQDRTGLSEQAIRALGPGGLEKYGEKLIEPRATSRGERPTILRNKDEATGETIVQSRDLKDPTKVYWEERTPADKLPVGQQKQINAMKKIYTLTKRVRDLASQEGAGEYTGKEGWTGGIREYTGPMSDKESAFRTAVTALEEEIIRPKEGAVIPPEMRRRFQEFLPNLYRTDQKFNTNVNDLLTTVETEFYSILDNARGRYDLRGLNLDAPTKQEVPLISPQTMKSSAVIDPGQGAGTIEELDKMTGGLTPEQRQRLQQHMNPAAPPQTQAGSGGTTWVRDPQTGKLIPMSQ